jgi:hypothetical protein
MKRNKLAYAVGAVFVLALILVHSQAMDSHDTSWEVQAYYAVKLFVSPESAERQSLCSSLVGKYKGKVYVQTAAHCVSDATGKVLLAQDNAYFGRPTQWASVRLAKSWGNEGEDVSLWVPATQRDKAALASVGYETPDTHIYPSPTERVLCTSLALFFDYDEQGNVLIATLPLPRWLSLGVKFKWDNESPSLTLLDRESYPGYSGSPCFSASGAVTGIIVAGLRRGTQHIPPTFMEGMEAIEKVHAFLDQMPESAIAPDVPRFSNFDKMSKDEQARWEKAYKANEEYERNENAIGFIYVANSVIISIKPTEKFMDDWLKGRIKDHGKLQDWGPYVPTWEVQYIRAKP